VLRGALKTISTSLGSSGSQSGVEASPNTSLTAQLSVLALAVTTLQVHSCHPVIARPSRVMFKLLLESARAFLNFGSGSSPVLAPIQLEVSFSRAGDGLRLP
jgi:hypothetical protein